MIFALDPKPAPTSTEEGGDDAVDEEDEDKAEEGGEEDAGEEPEDYGYEGAEMGQNMQAMKGLNMVMMGGERAERKHKRKKAGGGLVWARNQHSKYFPCRVCSLFFSFVRTPLTV